MQPNVFILQNFDSNNKISIKKHLNTKMHILHYHNCIEMSIIPYGTGIHFINGKEYTIEPGHFAVFDENDYHSIYGLSKKSCIYNLMINPLLISTEQLELLRNIRQTKICTLTKKDTQRVISLFDVIKDSIGLYSDQFYQNIIECLLFIFHSSFNKTPNPFNPENANSLQKILSYINDHFTENLSLQDLAKQFGYSVSHLSKQFHKDTGVHFHEYINHIRINHAKQLLQFSNNSVTHICYKCGYNSIASFSRNFKDFVGLSPTQFKNKYTPKDVTP